MDAGEGGRLALGLWGKIVAGKSRGMGMVGKERKGILEREVTPGASFVLWSKWPGWQLSGKIKICMNKNMYLVFVSGPWH